MKNATCCSDAADRSFLIYHFAFSIERGSAAFHQRDEQAWQKPFNIGSSRVSRKVFRSMTWRPRRARRRAGTGRNYQVRNFLRDQINVGDRVLFYHSSVDPPAVVGTAVVVRAGYPDHTAWQKKNHHFDPKSTAEKPIWYMVDIQLEEKFAQPLSLDELRPCPRWPAWNCSARVAPVRAASNQARVRNN